MNFRVRTIEHLRVGLVQLRGVPALFGAGGDGGWSNDKIFTIQVKKE
jgi:hypothetical protein